VHTSLDVVEEKLSSIGKTSSDVRELYLGLLYSTEEHKMYPSVKSVCPWYEEIFSILIGEGRDSETDSERDVHAQIQNFALNY